MSANLVDVGLPVEVGGIRVTRLAYCAASATLVATLAVPGASFRRFFIREQTQARYQELQPPAPQFSFFGDIAVAASAPMAFVLLMDGESRTNDSRLYAAKLPGGQLKLLPEPTGYPGDERVWATQLVASAPDATWLHIIVAEFSPPEADGGRSVIHSLARMDVSTGQLDRIVGLPTPFG